MAITQKGRYQVTDPNTGEVYEHNRHDKAYDRAIEVGAEWIDPPQGWEVMGFKLSSPPGQQANEQPTIDSTPDPNFTEGSAGIYSMSQHVTDDGVSPLTYSLTGTLAAGLSLNSSTGVLSYDGISGASTGQHQLVVDDGVNPAVTSQQFAIDIVGVPVGPQDILHPDMPWDHSSEPLGTAVTISGIWNQSTDPSSPSATAKWEIVNTDPILASQKYFKTTLIKSGSTNFRTERSEGREPRTTAAVSVSGTDAFGNPHFTAQEKYWYGFLLRIDQAQNFDKGHWCQWHNRASVPAGQPGGSPPLALTGRLTPTPGLEVRLEDNVDNNNNTYHSGTLTGLDSASVVGTTHAFIWEIFWDTRSASEGSQGIVRLYVDNNPTPVFEWLNKGNTHAGGVGSPARMPYFKYGFYKSSLKTSGSDGDTYIQSYTNYTVMGAGGSRLGMLAALKFSDVL